MLILINKLTEISKILDFPENSGIFPEIPDILFRNQWEVHQNGPSHKHTKFQNDWSISSRETGGVDSTLPPDSFIAQNTWTGDRVNGHGYIWIPIYLDHPLSSIPPSYLEGGIPLQFSISLTQILCRHPIVNSYLSRALHYYACKGMPYRLTY